VDNLYLLESIDREELPANNKNTHCEAENFLILLLLANLDANFAQFMDRWVVAACKPCGMCSPL
jgi:hypothetical protein